MVRSYINKHKKSSYKENDYREISHFEIAARTYAASLKKHKKLLYKENYNEAMLPFEVPVCTYAFFSDYAYAEPDLADTKTLGYVLPKGWSVLNISSNSYAESLENDGYFGIAFKNNRNIVFAHRGTVLSSNQHLFLMPHLINDLSLFFTNLDFTQFISARNFIDATLSQVNSLDSIKISFTGHSLGAALGEISGAYYDKKAVLFDNPGAKNVIDMNNYNRYNKESFDIVSYQVNQNILNNVCPTYATKINIGQYKFDNNPYGIVLNIISDYIAPKTHQLDYIIEALRCIAPEPPNIDV